ncbi:hypothetical protein CIHG_07536 [Coccidioides immitis H538.4]|uniref:Uncharacterized protein n=2 Tax=Coccidioides immitis TaxID=5501 RepID=A0A0J8UQK7_COCIT|nr:hypothetical protein CIRG_07827 [Coccidioides immitis RMSCC 2394]KMU89853.1 hypothetical protein CIHG_07536 [Coccidioides immitis H538.4]
MYGFLRQSVPRLASGGVTQAAHRHESSGQQGVLVPLVGSLVIDKTLWHTREAQHFSRRTRTSTWTRAVVAAFLSSSTAEQPSLSIGNFDDVYILTPSAVPFPASRPPMFIVILRAAPLGKCRCVPRHSWEFGDKRESQAPLRRNTVALDVEEPPIT